MNTEKGVLPVEEAPPAWHVHEEGGASSAPRLLVSASAEEGELQAVRSTLATGLGERVRLARGRQPRAALARALCVHENTIGKIERGESVPDVLQLAQIAGLYEKPLSWFLGNDTAIPPAEVAKSTAAVEVGDQVFVPLFDVYASAGHGTFESSEAVEGMRPFTRAYIRQHLGIRHDELAMVRVMGDSMEPEIHSGDIVLVDRKDTGVAVEGPHLVRMDGSLLLKGLQRRPGHRIRVSSRNHEYEAFEVQLVEGQTEFEILGRVRWAGVTFR